MHIDGCKDILMDAARSLLAIDSPSGFTRRVAEAAAETARSLGYEAQVDPIKLGYHILAFINLNVLPEDKPKFYAYANGVPNILECSCVTGEYSMLMKVAFPSTRELDIFVGQLQTYGKTSTQIVFSTHVGPRGVDVDSQ